jgi:CRP/FNR family cyclic AMP-dependent transcriptional regulator
MDSQIFRSVSFLSNLQEAEMAQFAELLTTREFRAKEKIIAEGEPIHAFYIVTSGTLHVRRLAQKREMLLARIGPGGFFGEVNLFEPGTATASIYAMDAVTLALVDYGRLRDFMGRNPAVGYKIVAALFAELSRRLRATNERITSSMYWSSLNAPAGE